MFRTTTVATAFVLTLLVASPVSAAPGDWIQFGKLTASDAYTGDQFGCSVAISGDIAIVGAFGNDDAGSASGSAYLFDVNTGTQLHKLTATDAYAGDYFGYSVGIRGDTPVVGAYQEGGTGSGYLFDAPSGGQVRKFRGSDTSGGDNFGVSVGISGNFFIVGAQGDDDAGSSSGSAYLFKASSGVQYHKLTASDAAAADFFGYSVGIFGGTAIVGAHGNDDGGSNSGSAYLFDVLQGTQSAKLTASDAAASDSFGASVAIGVDTAIVGAKGDDDHGSASGSAYLFDATTGAQSAKLTASDAAVGDEFGFSVGISGDIAIVGARNNDDGGSSSGSAYLFDTTSGAQLAKLVASDAQSGDYFGYSVAISDNVAIVGASGDDDGGNGAGAAYLFGRDSGFRLNSTPVLAHQEDQIGSLGDGDTLSGQGSNTNTFVGAASSTIVADEGHMTLGNASSYAGFRTEGTLDTNANTVTLQTLGFASLGGLTTLGGGTLAAANGVALGIADNLVGSGTVDARVAAGFGSSIVATGNLSLGSSTAYDGFISDGVLDTGIYEVTINDHNDAVLGSLTQLGDGAGGGVLTAGYADPADTYSHFLLEEGKNTVGRGSINGNFKNQGHVIGDGTGAGERLIFEEDWTVSGKGTFVNVEWQGTFAPGESPAVINATDVSFNGADVEFELGGLAPGFGADNHDQINDSASIWLMNDPSVSLLEWNNFVPTIGDEFVIMTWQTELVGLFGDLWVDPWFADHGISFDLTYVNPTGPGSLIASAVGIPETSTLAIWSLFALCGIGVGWRRRRKA